MDHPILVGKIVMENGTRYHREPSQSKCHQSVW